MVSLRQLSYFVATAQTGSATRAAKVLNVSQPSISAAIRELEVLLGKPLFVRKQARGLDLTPFGSLKLMRARDILDRAAQFVAEDAVGRLTVGYFSTIGPNWLPGILQSLRAALPGLEIELLECNLEQVAKAVDRGIIDLAISYDIGLPESAEREVLLDMAPYAIMATNHPLANQPQVTLAELARFPFVLVDLPISREFLMVPFWQIGLSPRVILRTTSVETVRSVVGRDDSVSILFTRAAHDLTVEGSPVVCKVVSDISIRQRLVVAWKALDANDQTKSRAVAAIKTYFAKTAGS